MTDQFLQAVFDHILGRDVVKKLMQVAQYLSTVCFYFLNAREKKGSTNLEIVFGAGQRDYVSER